MQSFKPQVKVNGNWNGNGLRFATEEEAERSAFNLFSRWTLCTDHRAEESDEPVKNLLTAEGELQFLEDVTLSEEEEQGGEQVSTYIVPHDAPEGTVIEAEEDKHPTA